MKPTAGQDYKLAARFGIEKGMFMLETVRANLQLDAMAKQLRGADATLSEADAFCAAMAQRLDLARLAIAR